MRSAAAPATRPRGGLALRVLRSWVAPARVVRELRGMPDTVLVVVLLVAMLVFFVAQMPAHVRAATLDPLVGAAPRIAGAALAVLFLMPLVAYGLAELVAMLSRLTPRRLSSHDARLALFWALLAVAPAMLLSGLTAGYVGPGAALTLTRVIAGAGFLFIWTAGMAALARPRSAP